jgi:hypothetical protein
MPTPEAASTPSVFARIEAVCATAVERAFATAFPSALEPVQVARKLVAAYESANDGASRTGRRYLVRMSDADFGRLEADLPYLERQWTAMLSRLAERSGRPARTPEVRVERTPGIAPGTVSIGSEALAPPSNVALRVRRGVPASVRLPSGLATVVVGRDPACDLVLVDPRVSRRHLAIACDGATYRCSDLGSSNGTRLNGVAFVAGDIGLGDVLSLGDSELVVESE